MLEGSWKQIELPAFEPGDVPWSAESAGGWQLGRRPCYISMQPPKTGNAMTVAQIAQEPDVERAIALFLDTLRKGYAVDVAWRSRPDRAAH
jgi:hypothetical protein